MKKKPISQMNLEEVIAELAKKDKKPVALIDRYIELRRSGEKRK